MGLFSGKAERNQLMYSIGQQQLAQQQAEALRLQGQGLAIGAIDAGQPLSLASLGQGFDKARTEYGNARDLYDPYAQAGQQGLGMYQNSLGLNGAAGNDAAVGAFRASPGYDYRVDQATDAYARKASSLGALGSGNTAAGISTLAGNLADQEYGGWQDRLQGLGQMGLQATGAQAGLTKGIGDLYAGQGAAEADVYGGNAKARAGVYTGLTGAGMSNIANSANAISGLSNSYMQHADDAAKNTWSLGLGVLSGLGNMAGAQAKGGGTLGSSLFKFAA